MNLFKVLSESLRIYKSDKWIVIYSLIPVIIGITLFGLIGNFIFTDLAELGRNRIEAFISSESLGNFLYYILVGIFSIAFFFVLNYCFILIVSLFASPFNDLISERVEKSILGKELPSFGKNFERLTSRIIFTLVNEFKKIVTILLCTIIVFFMSLFPLLSPVGLLLSALLMAASFLDYSWSRHDLKLGECITDMRKGFGSNTVAGAFFMFLITIPLVNLFAIPLAVIYFTQLFVLRKYHE